MVETAAPATPSQRRRAVALVVLCMALTAAGWLSRRPREGAAPVPCPEPALRDGVLVCDGDGQPVGARAWLVGQRLDVNTASRAELEAIPGVGPSTARAILETRAARGGFTSIGQLEEVPGIGPRTLLKLEPFLRVAPSR